MQRKKITLLFSHRNSEYRVFRENFFTDRIRRVRKENWQKKSKYPGLNWRLIENRNRKLIVIQIELFAKNPDKEQRIRRGI